VQERADALDQRRQEQIQNQVNTINHLKDALFRSYRIVNYIMMEENVSELTVTDNELQQQFSALILEDEDRGLWTITRRNP
jgi:hypothetical protein